MHALVLLCINQHTKFEVSSFTNYEDMIGAKFKKLGHVTLTTPLSRIVCYPWTSTCYDQPIYQI